MNTKQICLIAITCLLCSGLQSQTTSRTITEHHFSSSIDEALKILSTDERITNKLLIGYPRNEGFFLSKDFMQLLLYRKDSLETLQTFINCPCTYEKLLTLDSDKNGRKRIQYVSHFYWYNLYKTIAKEKGRSISTIPICLEFRNEKCLAQLTVIEMLRSTFQNDTCNYTKQNNLNKLNEIFKMEQWFDIDFEDFIAIVDSAFPSEYKSVLNDQDYACIIEGMNTMREFQFKKTVSIRDAIEFRRALYISKILKHINSAGNFTIFLDYFDLIFLKDKNDSLISPFQSQLSDEDIKVSTIIISNKRNLATHGNLIDLPYCLELIENRKNRRDKYLMVTSEKLKENHVDYILISFRDNF